MHFADADDSWGWGVVSGVEIETGGLGAGTSGAADASGAETRLLVLTVKVTGASAPSHVSGRIMVREELLHS